MTEIDALKSFLTSPLWTSTPIFETFRALDRAVYREDTSTNFHRFVYIPGTREDRVVLVAHADTVRDARYGYEEVLHEVVEEDGYLIGRSPEGRRTVLGADDRAGCAILWLLRDLGHSLLIMDGEENGQIGSNWLMNEHPDIADEINSHQFMVQFDRRNSHDFKCYYVGTPEFRSYVAQQTGYSEPNRSSYTDIGILCRDVCGVNLSVGYYNEHSVDETICIAEWQNTLSIARKWLSGALPRFALR